MIKLAVKEELSGAEVDAFSKFLEEFVKEHGGGVFEVSPSLSYEVGTESSWGLSHLQQFFAYLINFKQAMVKECRGLLQEMHAESVFKGKTNQEILSSVPVADKHKKQVQHSLEMLEQVQGNLSNNTEDEKEAELYKALKWWKARVEYDMKEVKAAATSSEVESSLDYLFEEHQGLMVFFRTLYASRGSAGLFDGDLDHVFDGKWQDQIRQRIKDYKGLVLEIEHTMHQIAEDQDPNKI